MQVIGQPVLGPGGQPLPLSAGRAHGGIIRLSGQLGIRDGRFVDGGIIEQTHAIFDNIEDLLTEAGSNLDDIISATVWLTRSEDFAGFNGAYASRLKPPFPARSTVICGLVVPQALVEVEVSARDHSSPDHND